MLPVTKVVVTSAAAMRSGKVPLALPYQPPLAPVVGLPATGGSLTVVTWCCSPGDGALTWSLLLWLALRTWSSCSGNASQGSPR